MIEPITFGIGMGAFLFGYIAHSNNTHKSSTKSIETMLDQNKEVISLSSTIEILNRDIDKKNSLIAELQGEAAHQQENINKLLERANNVKKSGELEKLEKTIKNLRRIKENLSNMQGKNVNRFNIGVLISIVQTLHDYIYNEELDLLGVQQLMEDFSDTGSDTGGDVFGDINQKPSKTKPAKPTNSGA